MPAPNQVPQRLPAGGTSDPPYGPLADSGMSNPFFYHQFADDFDFTLGATGLYTVSKGSTGTATHAAGDGGTITLTTAATNSDYVAIQLPAASFSLPQGNSKKLFFLTRLQISDATASAFIVGLCNTSATIFSAITDGIYFSKASGAANNLNIITNVSSTPVTTAVPTSAYGGALTNASYLDLGFYVDRLGNVNVFCSFPLVGFVPQSGSGTGTQYGLNIGVPQAGRVLQLATPSQTAVLLNPTMGIQAGAAAAKSLTADFWLTQKER